MKNVYTPSVLITKNYKRSAITTVVVLLLMFFVLPLCSKAQFTSGNIAVFVAASASGNNTTGSIVELNTTTAGQSEVSTYSISGTGTNALRFSGSAGTTAYLANSNDRSLLCFDGANNT